MKQTQYQTLERPISGLVIYVLLRNNQIAGWSPCEEFANSCAGRDEEVVRLDEG